MQFPSRLVPYSLAICARLMGIGLAIGAANAESVRFVAYGDAPYVSEAKVEGAIGGLIDAINARNPQLVIHVGDTQGGQPCTNSMTDIQRAMMNRLNAAVLYTPGDNEWRDCEDDSKSDQH